MRAFPRRAARHPPVDRHQPRSTEPDRSRQKPARPFYPLRQIEVGEEPDGQFTTPEDYGALYIQWADAIHAVDPTWDGALPATYLYDKDGKVVFKYFGAVKPAELRAAIDKAVGSKH